MSKSKKYEILNFNIFSKWWSVLTSKNYHLHKLLICYNSKKPLLCIEKIILKNPCIFTLLYYKLKLHHIISAFSLQFQDVLKLFDLHLSTLLSIVKGPN